MCCYADFVQIAYLPENHWYKGYNGRTATVGGWGLHQTSKCPPATNKAKLKLDLLMEPELCPWNRRDGVQGPDTHEVAADLRHGLPQVLLVPVLRV